MSCLFNSLSYHTKIYTSFQLRQLICDFLEEDPILIGESKFSQLIGNKSLRHYIQEMRNRNTWGSAFEIKAYCEIFTVIVLVKTIQNKFIEFLPSDNTITYPKKIKIEWNGYHYEPIRL